MKVYLDNGATTMTDPKVVKTMLSYFTKNFGNASSLHSWGEEAKKALENSRKIVAKALNAKPSEIIFTSGGTESDNLAIKGIAFHHGKGHIITSKIEHPAVLRSCKALERKGFEITYLDVDEKGFVNIEELESCISRETILVSIMHANNEIGTIQEISEIGKICCEKGIVFHTDAVQSFTKVPIDVERVKVDLISMSSHKIHGPKGVGALYIREGTMIEKLSDGGGHEFELRAGTENVSGIVGFAKAVSLCSKAHIDYMKELWDRLISRVLEEIPNTHLNGAMDKRLCNNANFSFEGVEGEAVLFHLNLKGIATSTGSACSSRDTKPSHVLEAIGLKSELLSGSLRLTLSRFNTKEEIDYCVDVLKEVVGSLREMGDKT
ncbi:MAG: cysteine desulfurase family protein [Candidatus Methanofastidiosia archaeon]